MFISFFGTKLNNVKNISFLKLKWSKKYLTILKQVNNVGFVSFSRMLHEGKKNYNDFVPFLEMIKSKQNQAKRSILVQVQSIKSSKELYSYCSQYGEIEGMYHYKTGKEQFHFILVEFQDKRNVQHVLDDCEHIKDSHIVPTESSFLWFKASDKKNPIKTSNKISSLNFIENSNFIIPENELKNKLQGCDNISEQIEVLYNSTKLNDIGMRLRFFTARQIEVALSGIFPNAVAFPFGSCVNGFGKMNCDLDIVLRLYKEKTSEYNRLIYHCKTSGSSERLTSQRHIEAVGDLIHLFLPGCSQVRKILQARVPIIKYYQQLTDVECDLSMGNMSGVHMSDLLHIFGSIDKRVRPLVFIVKKWAEEVGLTNNFPGRWITNFSITLLVLGFLQKPKDSPSILPSLNYLVKFAETTDKYVTEDGIDCTFLRDIRKLNFKTGNKESLESLLIQLFDYYSTFDFDRKAVCLNHGSPITKPEFSPLYIVNPIERGLNVSKNVSAEELGRLKLEMRNALWSLQSKEEKADEWGILSLFGSRRQYPSIISTKTSKSQSRLMDVSKIFEENEDVKSKKEPQKSEMKISGFESIMTKEVKNNDSNKQNNIDNLEVQIKHKSGS